MLFFIRFKRLFYLSLLSLVCISTCNNIKSSAISSKEQDYTITNDYKINNDTTKVQLRKSASSSSSSSTNPLTYSNLFSLIRNLLSNNINDRRHTQEVTTCEESTCNVKLSISLRIIPLQDKISEAETFIKSCALPNTIKQFKQNGNEMFVARVCMNNIFNIQGNEIIKKIEGGTKSTKSKFIRKKPKVLKVQKDCNGSCCKTCKENKVHKVMAQLAEPIVNEDGFNLIKECNVGAEDPKLITTSPVTGRSVDGQRYMFHICKEDKHVIKKSNLISSFRRYVVKKKKKPNNIPEEQNNQEGEEQNNQEGEEQNNQDGEEQNNQNQGEYQEKTCAEGDCCKACVISDAIEEGQYPETDPNQIMKVVFTIKSGKAKTFMRTCATAGLTDVVQDDGSAAYSTTICKDDFDTISRNGHIKSIAEDASAGTER